MIITLSGANGFRLQQELRKLVQNFTKEHGDFGLERLSAGEVEYPRLLESVQAMPFLTPRQLVVISNPASNKDLAEKITDLLAGVNDQTDVIFVEPKFDKRSSLYKTFKKETDFREFNELDEQGLARWLIGAAKQAGGEISSGDARYLVQRVSADQLKLSSELAKLLSYNPKITQESIDLLTVISPQSTVFELLDAAFGGNKKRSLQLYQEQRQQKVEPQAILAMLAWQLHVLAVVKTAGDKPVDQIAKESKLNPFVVRKSASLARAITLQDLRRLVDDTLTLDVRLKSETIDADSALQNLLISL